MTKTANDVVRRRVRCIIAPIACLILFSGFSAGCGGGSKSATGTTATTNSSSSVYRVGYITTKGVSFFTCFSNGIRDSVKSGGNQFVEAVASYDRPGSEIDAAENLLAQKVNAVIYLSTNPRAGPGVVALLYKHHVKIVTVNDDSYLKGDHSKLAARYVYDLYQLGQVAGELTNKAFPKGTITGAVEPAPGQGIHAIYQGFENTVKKAGSTYVGSVPVKDYTPSELLRGTEDLLASHPDVKVIFTDDTDPTSGMIGAIRSANSHAVIIAVGGADADKQRLKTGQVAAVSAVQAYGDGSRAGQIVNAVLAGKKPPYQKEQARAVPITKQNVNTLPPYCGPVKRKN